MNNNDKKNQVTSKTETVVQAVGASRVLDPIPVTLENGPEKLSGFIMKISSIGLMVELEKITFKVGTYLTAVFAFGEGATITERVRSVKHYKDFYRTRVKKPKAGEAPPVPKLLCELHFHMPLESTRVAISKFLIKNKASFKK